MATASEIGQKLFAIDKNGFDELALEVFRFQYQFNKLYASYVDTLSVHVENVRKLTDIPFLPIRFFKTQEIKTTSFEAEAIFESSGTTQTVNSKHHVKELALYTQSFTKGFEKYYGSIENWCIIGLLPSYLERKNSSLVSMVDYLVKKSPDPRSGFYLYEHERLYQLLKQLESEGRQTLLIGVTFALLDFAEQFPIRLNHTTVMETGGMKGRRKELAREEAQAILKKQFNIPFVHAEYGMTELLSQAYSKGGGLFEPVPWMKMLLRKEDDPFDVQENGAGIMNVIDLANLYSCSFIATDDVGQIYRDGSFEISGRVDNSDIRGCSLLIM
ncbi:MAG: acyl transferase [Bacteroidetes bacterium]|nr:acyl transferase [Bacteroidota bacterium]